MDERNPDFEAALAPLLEEKTRDGEHVTPERLVAYHHDRLPPEEADAVQEHLAACRPCADLLLELGRFGDDESARGEGDGVVDLEERADWRALRSRIAESEAGSRPPYLAYALAASLLLAAGLGVWVAVLQGELQALREPQANLAIVNLETEGFTRGGADEGTVRGDGGRFVVILNPPSFPAAVEHRVEILDTDGRPVWSGGGLEPTEAGNFPLELSRQMLAPGSYRIRLLAGDELVAEFDLRLAP